MTLTQNKTVCLDMEGVLAPELWPQLAKKTGLKEFNITTRDVPDYSALMCTRISLLRTHRITLKQVQALLVDVDIFPGARRFVEELKRSMNVVLVSDAFVEMIAPFHEKLGQPPLLCNHFSCDSDGFITQSNYIRHHGKHEAVEKIQALGDWVAAVGDAYNDLSMLRAANLGFLFRPSIFVKSIASDIYVAQSYDEILLAIPKVAP
jgi:phosphoserine / homoserine phosphotransferase